MYPIIFRIYGPIALHSFSLCFGLSIAVFLICMHYDASRKAIISDENLINGTINAGIWGILGARFLHILTEWYEYNNFYEIFFLWNGGLSLLGSIIAVIIYARYFLKKHNVALVPALDLTALYVPLTLSIARLGCFLAGCCHGIPSNALWAIKYTNPECVAPLNIYLHPTQLYSSLFFLLCFITLYGLKNRLIKRGQKLSACLMLIGFERFYIDFFRGDRVFTTSYFSVHQWIALGIIFCSFILLIKATYFSSSQKAVHL